MRKILIFLSVVSLTFILTRQTFCQQADTVTFKINTRYSFYSHEKDAEILLHVPVSWSGLRFDVGIKIDGKNIASFENQPGEKIIRLSFPVDLAPGRYTTEADIKVRNGSPKRYSASTSLLILSYKSNEVKTDKLTGGLIVNRRQFFPFGFYCYSPVYPTLPEEEAVKGFNMISPYQKVMPETLNERKAYMDRCAQLGMKVHYNLLSVSGGGGVGSKIEGLTDDEKKVRLLAEIRTFMDHPALLAWYIADEPTGNRISPAELEEIYRTVRSADPWHPVSIVFMAPFLSSRRYVNALDIVMADPYPVPTGSPVMVGRVSDQLRKEFEGKKSVWIVPQAFGGGEWWGREPTIQEVRLMTWLSIINGARGVQYFVRQGLNAFPKSTATWNECGKMAMEIAEITPWLLSDEDAPAVRTESGNIQVSSALHDGQLLVMAVNTSNAPKRADIRISGVTSGNARVIFENRSVAVTSGIITDYLSAYGSQVYLISISPKKELVIPFKGNLLKDPGFEDLSSPGVPAACYAWNSADRGATFFLDPVEHVEGNHSLRMITPAKNKSARLRFFPVNLKYGRTYMLSVWAKADPVNDTYYDADTNRVLQAGSAESFPVFELSLGEYGRQRFVPESGWKQFMTSFTVPADSKLPPRVNVILQMPGAGKGWFDMLQIFEAIDIGKSINPELRDIDFLR